MDNTYPDPTARRGASPQGPHGPARRTFLAGGLGALLLPLAGCGSHSDGDEDVVSETRSFTSRARGGVRTSWTLMRPADATGDLPVVVALHGLHQNHTAPAALGAASALAGVSTPLALVAPDGGTTYWHPHDGEDAGAMVTDELLPRLPALGLRTERIGLIGWSMGGYGALRIAGLLGSSRVAGVAGVSPALWTDPATASRSGFDDASEYRRYSVMGAQSRLDGIRVRVDCGLSDPFADAVRVYRDGFAHRPSGGFTFGSHDRGYWRRVLPRQLDFLGSTLAA
jgi:S-formylglutathione hydrolase FrmB